MNVINEFDVLYEDNHIIALNKRAGVLTQTDYREIKSLQDLCRDFLRIKYNKPGNIYLGIVHRLDMSVSGTILFAKTDKAASRLSEMIRKHELLKLYLAVSARTPRMESSEEKTANFFIGRNHDISFISDKKAARTESASLSYQTVSQSSDWLLNLINLGTGRKHQIRAFFSHYRSPIAFDVKYGSAQPKRDYILLHSFVSAFIHPVKKEPVVITAPPPDYFSQFAAEQFGDSFLEKAETTSRRIVDDFFSPGR